MRQAISHLPDLIAKMEAILNQGIYVYTTIEHQRGLAGLTPIAMMCEAEAVTIVIDEAQALAAQLPVLFRAAWITLNVHSDLQAVGLTAAFASALGDAGISCNVIAGAYHDHIFVPLELADAAMQALQALQKSVQESP